MAALRMTSWVVRAGLLPLGFRTVSKSGRGDPALAVGMGWGWRDCLLLVLEGASAARGLDLLSHRGAIPDPWWRRGVRFRPWDRLQSAAQGMLSGWQSLREDLELWPSVTTASRPGHLVFN